MIYLDVLIGFSLVMLVFASAVTVAQQWVKKLFAFKGRALVELVLAEVGRDWEPNAVASVDGARRVEEALRSSLKTAKGELVETLRTVSIRDAGAVVEALGTHGQAVLKAMERQKATPAECDEYQARWGAMQQRLALRWDDTSARLAAIYDRNTKRSVYVIALVAALLFNVDAIRILRVLSVNTDTRTRLNAMAPAYLPVEEGKSPAAEHAAGLVDPSSRPPLPATLSDWQRENFAEIAGTGLPLGWERAPLTVRVTETARSGCLWGHECAGTISWSATVLLWLVRLLGLIVGAGLIGQGAPFWYSLLDSVVGLKKRVGEAQAAKGKGAVEFVRVVGEGTARKAAAGGEEER